MTTRKDNHRHERAKNLIAGKGASCSEGYARGGATDEPDGEPLPKGKRLGGPVSYKGKGTTVKPEAQGKTAKKRLDKRPRYASGGGIDDMDTPKKKGKSGTTVNIVIAGKGDQPTPPPMPVPVPAGGPPMPPPGAMPPGGAPGMPPGMPPKPGFKSGGAIKEPKTKYNAGSGGGLGRLEKAAAQKRDNKPGKNGS